MDSGRPAGARAAAPRGAAAQWNDLVSRREAELVRLPRGRVSASAEPARPAEVREAREVREVDSGRPAGARAAAPRDGRAARRAVEPVREQRAPDFTTPGRERGADRRTPTMTDTQPEDSRSRANNERGIYGPTRMDGGRGFSR